MPKNCKKKKKNDKNYRINLYNGPPDKGGIIQRAGRLIR